MSLMTRTLPALMNGISQQPAILRAPDQTEDELNTWGRIASGLSRRPPTATIKKIGALTDINLEDATVHHINRDINERYTVIVDTGLIRVFDETTGIEKTVAAPKGWGYLDAPGDDYRVITIADYTFIVNTAKTVLLKGVAADEAAPDPEHRLPGGNAIRDLNDLPADWSRLIGFAKMQYAPNPDSSGGLTGTVPSPDKLPDPVCSGCIYKVLGATDTAFVSYYVRGDGTVWNETVKPGIRNGLDETTMPHALVRESDGTFTFAPFSWKPRRVGDQETNPVPPFVDAKIRDVFFYANRLGFLVDETVVFSAAGDYGEFFRRTVLDYIDSDTVAAASTTTDVTLLDYAVPFSDGIMLFSRQRQFSLTNGDSGLSAHSLSIQPVTAYVMAPEVRPTPMGTQVHFVANSSGRAAVQEYTRLSGADPTDAADITAHVPTLIPEGASRLIPATDMDALFVLVRNAPNEADRHRMFAYQFFWDGDKKLQSAWRVWDFGDGKPLSGSYEDGALHLLMERPDGYFLEKLDLSPAASSDDQDHLIYLDRSESVTGVYDAVSDTTTFTLTYEPDPDLVRVVRGAGSAYPETTISPDRYTLGTLTVTVPGDETDAPATIGHVYVSRTVVSRQFPIDYQGRPLSSGRLVLHNFSVNLVDTAYIRAEVYPYGRDAAVFDPGLLHTSVFTPQSLGSASALLGRQTYASDTFTFSVAGNSELLRIELINDSPYSSTFTSAEWEGLYWNRAF